MFTYLKNDFSTTGLYMFTNFIVTSTGLRASEATRRLVSYTDPECNAKLRNACNERSYIWGCVRDYQATNYEYREVRESREILYFV